MGGKTEQVNGVLAGYTGAMSSYKSTWHWHKAFITFYSGNTQELYAEGGLGNVESSFADDMFDSKVGDITISSDITFI